MRICSSYHTFLEKTRPDAEELQAEEFFVKQVKDGCAFSMDPLDAGSVA
jgi:hypothetical protein